LRGKRGESGKVEKAEKPKRKSTGTPLEENVKGK
jgi:hypothetical protein